MPCAPVRAFADRAFGIDQGILLCPHNSIGTSATTIARNGSPWSPRLRSYLSGTGASDDKLLVRNAGDAEGKNSTDPTSCRVDVQVVQGDTQLAATHEMGHQVGMEDEYVSAGAQSAAYKQMVRDAGGGEVGSQQDAALMSGGNRMDPRTYAAFVEAMNRITGSDRWSL